MNRLDKNPEKFIIEIKSCRVECHNNGMARTNLNAVLSAF